MYSVIYKSTLFFCMWLLFTNCSWTIWLFFPSLTCLSWCPCWKLADYSPVSSFLDLNSVSLIYTYISCQHHTFSIIVALSLRVRHDWSNLAAAAAAAVSFEINKCWVLQLCFSFSRMFLFPWILWTSIWILESAYTFLQKSQLGFW